MRGSFPGLIVLGLTAVVGCGGSDTKDPEGAINVGDQVDVDGDGVTDGTAIDTNNDGIADAVDTNGDGIGDKALPDGSGGQTGGSTNGASTGSAGASNTTGGQNGLCEEHAVRNDKITPDMLIVLDKSGSMGGQGGIDCRMPNFLTAFLCNGVDCNDPANAPLCGGGDRWGPSVMAIKGITKNLEDTIRFGLMAFPANNDQCGAGDLYIKPEIQMADEIASQLDMLSPNGGTPTSLTLEKALEFYKNVPIQTDAQPHPQYVLLVTDGDPNCVGNQGQTGDTQAQNASFAAIDALAKAGVKTYVIGYDTKTSSFAGVLDEMAKRGDTGDTAHRPVEDQASLEMAFREIAGRAISCAFVLDEAPPNAEYVQVKVDGMQINLNEPNGWTLSEDGRKVQVQGESCKRLQDGKEHLLTVDVKCQLVKPV